MISLLHEAQQIAKMRQNVRVLTSCELWIYLLRGISGAGSFPCLFRDQVHDQWLTEPQKVVAAILTV